MAEATVVPDRAGEKVQQGAENAKRSGRAGPTLASIVAQWQQTIGNSGVAQLSAVSATETDPDAEPAPPSAVGAAAAVAEQSRGPTAGGGAA